MGRHCGRDSSFLVLPQLRMASISECTDIIGKHSVNATTASDSPHLCIDEDLLQEAIAVMAAARHCINEDHLQEAIATEAAPHRCVDEDLLQEAIAAVAAVQEDDGIKTVNCR